MELTIRIRRMKDGILEARVVQAGRAGANLLARRQITSVDSAQREAERSLRLRFKDVTIKWRVPELPR